MDNGARAVGDGQRGGLGDCVGHATLNHGGRVGAEGGELSHNLGGGVVGGIAAIAIGHGGRRRGGEDNDSGSSSRETHFVFNFLEGGVGVKTRVVCIS